MCVASHLKNAFISLERSLECAWGPIHDKLTLCFLVIIDASAIRFEFIFHKKALLITRLVLTGKNSGFIVQVPVDFF